MNVQASIILLTAIFVSCSTDEKSKSIRWDAAATLPADSDDSTHIGVAGPVTGIIGDRLLIAGGANFPDKMPWDGGAKHYASQVFVYQINGDGLTFLNQQEFPETVAYSGNCSVGSAIYFAGGENEQGAVPDVKTFTMVQDTIVEEALPDLPLALTNGRLVSASDKLYFVGGENADLVSDKIYMLDLTADAGAWEEAYILPYPVSNAVVVSNQKDKLYIAGGRMRNPNGLSTIYDELLEVDLTSATTTKIANLPHASAAGTGVWDEDGNILLFGGDHAETFHQAEALIAKINQTTDAGEKDRLNLKKANIQRAHPGFSPQSWSFDPIKRQWTRMDDIIGASPVTTTALLHDNTIIIPSGEIRAGVRTNQILTGKLSIK